MKARIAVTGSTGQLGSALSLIGREQGFDVISLRRKDCDFNNPYQKLNMQLAALPEVDGIINAAAYTNVDKAEKEQEIAFQVNGRAPGVLAEFFAARDVPVVHISTDYVFAGNKPNPYLVDDLTGPVNIYGASKLAGELAVLKAGGPAAILRTSWVFDGQRNNFLTKMLQLAQSVDSLNIVNDQRGRPTHSLSLAAACLRALEGLKQSPKNVSGIFHVSGSGPVTTWAGFALEIFDAAQAFLGDCPSVNPIPSSDYPTPARRPSNSVLDTSKSENILKIKSEDWRDMVKVAVRDFYSQGAFNA